MSVGLAVLLLVQAQGQDTKEILIITVHGNIRTYVVPGDWRPVFDEEKLWIKDQDWIWTRDVAAIRPRVPVDISHMREVKLAFRAVTGKKFTQYFWMPNEYATVEDAPRVGDFHQLDEMTFVRTGGYTLELE